MQLWEQIKTKAIDYVTTKGLDFAKAIFGERHPYWGAGRWDPAL